MKYEEILYRPPSEAGSLIFQVTIGCAHNGCTFCTMYDNKRFHIRDMDAIRADFEEMSHIYGSSPIRIFLADGDALAMPYDKLITLLGWIREFFPFAERVTCYGSALDILRKDEKELKSLKDMGLYMVYIGAESGDNAVLEAINKKATSDEIIESGKLLKKCGIKTSVTLISGLGGKARLKEHAIGSARLISRMKPDFVGFLTLMLDKKAPIYKDIKEGRLELLSPPQIVDEMELLLSNVDSEGTVFRSNHASNYMSLKGNLNKDIEEMLDTLRVIREKKLFKSEAFREL